MLPLAGSDPTLIGFDTWLNQVSIMHLDSKQWGGTVAWLSANWKYHFQQGLSPRNALIVESTRQTEARANEAMRTMYGARYKLANDKVYSIEQKAQRTQEVNQYLALYDLPRS